jgi:hypothetical protein
VILLRPGDPEKRCWLWTPCHREARNRIPAWTALNFAIGLTVFLKSATLDIALALSAFSVTECSIGLSSISEETMQDFILDEDLKVYRAALSKSTDEEKRRVLLVLLQLLVAEQSGIASRGMHFDPEI